MTRSQLIWLLNTAYHEGCVAAELNLGWTRNPHPVGSQEWYLWSAGYRHTLEDLARKEWEARQ